MVSPMGLMFRSFEFKKKSILIKTKIFSFFKYYNIILQPNNSNIWKLKNFKNLKKTITYNSFGKLLKVITYDKSYKLSVKL